MLCSEPIVLDPAAKAGQEGVGGGNYEWFKSLTGQMRPSGHFRPANEPGLSTWPEPSVKGS